jgi:hypothetical protein
MGPIYNNEAMGFSTWPGEVGNHSIINALAPVYTIDASAGNIEMLKNIRTHNLIN